MAVKIKFFFELASTYSYLAATRIGAVAEAAGIEVQWEPFLLGPIFRAQGIEDSPFNQNAAKGSYMWRDLERLCESYGLPFRRPSKFPRHSLLATRVAWLGRGETWLPDYARAVYHAEFADDRDIADPMLLADILASLELPAEALLARADESQTKNELREQGRCAQKLGIFGAPTFVVGSELFWGNDRMGDSIAWALIGAQASA